MHGGVEWHHAIFVLACVPLPRCVPSCMSKQTSCCPSPALLTNCAQRAAPPCFPPCLGDERAEKTARKWGRPLQAVVVTNCGLL